MPPRADAEAWAEAAAAARLQARQFTATYPNDTRGLEADASLSMAMSDDDGVDAAFAALMALAPEKTSGGLAWAEYWAARDTARSVHVLERLLDDRPDARLYMKSLFQLLSQTEIQRLHDRMQKHAAPDADLDRAALELDMLARTVPPLAAIHGFNILQAHPDHLDLRIATARGLRHANRFADARRMLEAIEPPLQDPGHVYLWSDVCYADHDFVRALRLLESIDLEAIETSRPGLHRRLNFMLPVRREAVDSWPDELVLRASEAKRGANPLARMQIEGQEVMVELFEDTAPNTVANFIAAADLGIFDGYEAGQVHTGFRTIMGGRHDGDGLPTWTIPDEHESMEARPIVSGSLVAYRTSRPASGDTEFFVLHFPAPHLNTLRTTFGRVLSGLDVIRGMEQGDEVDSIEILRRREHAYDPTVLDEAGVEMRLSELLQAR
ncbi:MAG: peptidylprolyl isomerase [Phycisphaerales bacterium]|jgi:peptidyl-prolyl cis-trans isomerase B (cyclophilin B)|nr:peptidylprolyl isomerase [Phycisphaerales bacterium]